jgi:dolichyl-phosphate beta-glucosyltransferase
LTLAALVPILPVPIGVRDRPPVPAFITDGTWQRYVDERHSLVGIPAASVGNLEAMRWAAISRVGFAIPGGYYLGPDGAFGAPPRPTSTLLDLVAATGNPPNVTDKEINDATTDLRFWHAAVVVIVPGSQTEAVKRTVTNLLDFEPSLVDGIWLWDVRGKLG